MRSNYLDISKAFDRVWHDGFTYKLQLSGVSGHLLYVVQSFLTDRQQRIVLNGKCSSWGDISAGVPPDSGVVAGEPGERTTSKRFGGGAKSPIKQTAYEAHKVLQKKVKHTSY